VGDYAPGVTPILVFGEHAGLCAAAACIIFRVHRSSPSLLLGYTECRRVSIVDCRLKRGKFVAATDADHVSHT
jgi:hypothetical protein